METGGADASPVVTHVNSTDTQTLQCPACRRTLEDRRLKGLAIVACPQCGGTWLAPHQLDELEDTVFDKDELKGTVVFRAQESPRHCPVCEQTLKRFKYRLYDLELDYCEQGHGFWLDKGEADRVQAIMREEADKTARKFELEDEWSRVLGRFKSKGFVASFWDLFR